MTQEPMHIYVATYASLDRATDDMACVRRLQRDGIIAPDDSTVIARDAASWVTQRDASSGSGGGTGGRQAVDRVLELLFPAATPGTVGNEPGKGSAPSPAWMLDGDLQELQEQLAAASAAVIVVGAIRLAPVVSVALARASSLLDLQLTAEGSRLARGPVATADAVA